jgi:hypothetical protein
MKKKKDTSKLTVEERWEQGIPHNKQSVTLFNAIRKIDEDQCDGQLDLQAGGDGDIGEELMYRMDVYFSKFEDVTVLEVIADKVHEGWMTKKKSQGFKEYYSSKGEDLFVPYTELSEEQKDLDRATARSVIEGIEEAGRFIVQI